MQFRVIVVTDPQTHPPHTHRQDRLQYTVPQLAHSVINDCSCVYMHVVMWLLTVAGSVELVDVSDRLPGLVRENSIYSWRVRTRICVTLSPF